MVICLMNYFFYLNPIIQVLIAGIICFIFTSAGAFLVLLCKNIKQSVFDGINSISSGIMISAAFFSLLLPAINSTKNVFIVIISFIIGGLFIYISNKLLEKLDHMETEYNLKRCFLLFTSITLHNIPEGMVVGVAFGGSSIMAAISLTIAIALQNFPEGAAITFPLNKAGLSKNKSFLFGVLSGIVEPIAAIIGYLLVLQIKSILPVILAIASSVMLYVIVLEIIPECQRSEKKDLMALLTIIGFCFMMLLEFILG